jgi:hypothetical protein
MSKCEKAKKYFLVEAGNTIFMGMGSKAILTKRYFN